ncbi:MAG: glycosyltransferase [Ectothiorhodospiraceae bacterium]|nr:glycosyltransferase [Ectothiorhodospiraceae bacterium]
MSIVVPLYNEEESLQELADRVKDVLQTVAKTWEVWFIDDGSNDGSFKVLQNLHRSDRRFKVIRFRRNYGKSAALSVGFEQAVGDIVITMDADLQDDPAEIPSLMEAINSGYDMVSGWKKKRYDPITKTIPSKFFNYVTSKVSGIKLHDFNCGLKGYKNDVIKNVDVYGEMHRYIPVLAKMAGFSVTEVVVQHHPRKYGVTKFGLSRFYKGFLDLVTVYFLSKYTQRPLHIFGSAGSLLLLAGLGINIWLTIQWMQGYPVGDRPMLMLGVLLMLVGIQLVSTGLLAEMIAKNGQESTEYGIKKILRG